MKKYLPLMMKSPLFVGMSERDIEKVLSCMGVTSGLYAKGEFVYRIGDKVKAFGLVLQGSVHIVKEDFWGNRNIIARIGAGQIFAETYACLGMEELGVDVEALETSEVLFLDMKKLLEPCGQSCHYHKQLIQNLLHVLAGKNLLLTGKLEHVMQRSTREKLLSYLSEQSRLAHSPEFTIPFDRQQLADYLSVERSAMSHELAKLRKEEMIEFRKNEFHLIRRQ